MPFYEYECQSCEHYFRDFLKMSEHDKPTKEPCPECGKEQIKQVYTTCPSIVSGATVKDKRPEWFKDRLKDMKKNVGRDNTLNDSI